METCSSSTERPVPEDAALARAKPPMVIGTLFDGAPLIVIVRGSPAP